MLDHSCQVQRHPLADRGHDLYETPAVAVHALLRVERLPHVIWEPACGPGAIVRVLRDAGHDVMATDLVRYKGMTGRLDFLKVQSAPPAVQAIVTNPPFKIANQFVAHAIELCPLVVMLLRLAFLESEVRSSILDGGKLARVHVFRRRLPMLHRAGWKGPKASSAIPFAWMVWDRSHRGPARLHRLSWDR